MKNLRNIFMIALVALIVCCLFLNCCRIEGLENPPKDTITSNMTEQQCLEHNGVWDGENCTINTVDQEENIPTPEEYSNYY